MWINAAPGGGAGNLTLIQNKDLSGLATATINVSGYTKYLIISSQMDATGLSFNRMRFNGDVGANYSFTRTVNTGAALAAANFGGQTFLDVCVADNVNMATVFIIIENPAAGVVKGFFSHSGKYNYLMDTAGEWSNAANNITSITIYTGGGTNWAAGSFFAVYGVS